jgi:hypothetical protein
MEVQAIVKAIPSANCQRGFTLVPPNLNEGERELRDSLAVKITTANYIDRRADLRRPAIKVQAYTWGLIGVNPFHAVDAR